MRKRKLAFTLVEVIASLLILGTLVGFAVPRYMESQKTARANTFVANVREIKSALEAYRASSGVGEQLEYPTSLIELQDFTKDPVNPYTNQTMLSNDPLGSGIIYSSDGLTYSLCVIQRDADDINKNDIVDEPLPMFAEESCDSQAIPVVGGRSIMLVVNPASAGSPSVAPSNISVGNTVTLSANPKPCYSFTGWSSSDVTISNNQFVIPNKNVTIVANYTPIQYNITVIYNKLYGTVAGTGTYDCGKQVTLIAVPVTNNVFNGWYENGNQVSTDLTYTFTATSNHTLEARFGRIITTTITEDTQAEFQNGTLSNISISDNKLLLKQIDSTLKFDGNGDYIYIPRINNTGFGAQFTLEMIITPNPPVGPAQLFTINRTRYDILNQAGLQLSPNNGGWNVVFWDCCYYGVNLSVSSRSILQPNQTYHLAIVKNGGTGTFYINGNFDGSSTSLSTVFYGSNNVAFGADYRDMFFGSPRYYNGYIKEIRMWNIARSQSDIQSNMNRQLTGNEPGLVGYWKLDEGNGTIANDSTQNNSDGTIYGAQWISGYASSGTRTSPVYNIANDSILVSSITNWIANTPIDTSVVIETRVSLDGGTTWSDWQQCTNGGAVPGLPVGTDLSNARIQIRQTLNTNNTNVTPELNNVTIQIISS